MANEITTVEQYLDQLPEDRRLAIETVRKTIVKNLPKGYEEAISYGMIGYVVPHSIYPDGYHCNPELPLPFASLASQKSHMAFYCMGIYMDPEEEARFRNAWLDTGKKLDMGKSCIRFKKIEDVPLNVIGQMVKRTSVKKFIANYETAIKKTTKQKPVTKATNAKKKPIPKKAAKKKPSSGRQSN